MARAGCRTDAEREPPCVPTLARSVGSTGDSRTGCTRRAGPRYRSPMRIFEPHAHMFSRVTDDYERMALAGIRAVLEPAFWLGQPRTQVGSFIDYFDTLLG